MKRDVWVILAAMVAPVLAYVLFFWPMESVIEFQARGETGKEILRVTKNWSMVTLLKDEPVGKKWRTYRLETSGPLVNVRIYFMNPAGASPLGKVLYIRNGLVKCHSQTLFGHQFAGRDILDIESTYHYANAWLPIREDSAMMATVRSGVTGWAGFYELYP